MYRDRAKRALDICTASLGLLLAAPICVALFALVWMDVGYSPLFSQSRPGKDEKPFDLIKFRTMTNARDAQGNLLPDAQRITRLGRFLRHSSLDEIPELWNVLRGDMSIVGPRPLKMEYLPLYSPEQARRHQVRPGITGWAQVNGRNSISWDERFALDLWYVDHVSLPLDIRICLMTAREVIKQTGITAEGHATMPRFEGSAPVAQGEELTCKR